VRTPLLLLQLVIGSLVLVVACGSTTDDESSPVSEESSSASNAADTSDALFDPAVIHEVEMELTDRDLGRLEPPTDERVPVRLTVDGETVEGAGVRLKGGSAQFQGLDAKPGFSIKTDEFVDGQELFDVARFTLGNAALDPSFVAEHLAYNVFREAGIPVARTALARVTVNGEHFGIYVMRESYDKRWLGRHFEDPEGNLYEVPDESLTRQDGDLTIRSAIDTELEPRTNENSNDAGDLDAIAAVVANTPDEEYREAIEELVDVDELLTYWAVEGLVGHWDGYAYDVTAPGRMPPPARPPGNSGINNFYAYVDPLSGRAVVIPHGADLTFGLGGTTWTLDPATAVLTPPKVDATVAARLWEQPGFPEELADRVSWVLEDAWDQSTLLAEAEMLAEHIRADGLTGSREWVDPAGFESALAARKDWIRQRERAVRAELRVLGSPTEPGQGS
jgi:spore coat protein H